MAKPQNSNPFAPNFQPFYIPENAPIRRLIGPPNTTNRNAKPQNSNPFAPGFAPFEPGPNAPIRRVLGTDTSSGNRDEPQKSSGTKYSKDGSEYTTNGVTYDLKTGQAINPDTGKISPTGYSINPQSGARTDTPAPVTPQVTPSSAPVASTPERVGLTAEEVVDGFGNDFGSMKSTRLSDALRGAQVGIVQKRMDAGENFGYKETETTPMTTYNPSSLQSGTNLFADMSDQYRALDIPQYSSQQFASNPKDSSYEDLFNGNNLTGILTYFKDKK